MERSAVYPQYVHGKKHIYDGADNIISRLHVKLCSFNMCMHQHTEKLFYHKIDFNIKNVNTFLK